MDYSEGNVNLDEPEYFRRQREPPVWMRDYLNNMSNEILHQSRPSINAE